MPTRIRAMRALAASPVRSDGCAPSSRFGPLLGLAAMHVGADASILFVCAREHRQLGAVSWTGLSPEQSIAIIPFMQSDAELALAGTSCSAPDAPLDVRRASAFTLSAVESAGFRRMIAVPLGVSRSTRLGLMVLLGNGRVRRTASSIERVRVIGDHAAELALCHEELRERRVGERQLRALVDSLPEAIIRFDAGGTIESASPSVTGTFGYAPAELVGMQFRELVHADDRARVVDPIAEHAASGRGGRFGRSQDVRLVRKDGRVTHGEIMFCEIDPRARFVGVIRDVDDRRSAEARLRQNDRLTAMGTLAAGLGHDMNNVLLPIRAHLNAIEAAVSSAPPRAVGHVAEINKGVSYLQQLADGLHYLATDAGSGRDHEEGTDLSRWWASTGSLLSCALPPLTAVKWAIRPDLPRVQVSEQALTQAVLNLFVNAGEAIAAADNPGGGRVTVRASATADGRSVALTIEDNGAGMDEAVRRRAFDMFFTTKARGLGSGLGLALVHRVVTEAGGVVSVESKPGTGTTMRLELPVVELAHGGSGGRVAVTLADGRVSDFVCAAVDARGFMAVPTEHAVDATAWIADPRVVRMAEARRWLSAGAGRIVVLFGRLTSVSRTAWRGIARATVDHGNDFDALLVGVDRACNVILKEAEDRRHGTTRNGDDRGHRNHAGACEEEGDQPDDGRGGGGGPPDVRG